MSDDKLNRIEEKLDHISTTLVKQQVILDEHVRRTNILEEKFEPVETHVKNLQGVVKFFKFIGVLAAIAEALRLVFK